MYIVYLIYILVSKYILNTNHSRFTTRTLAYMSRFQKISSILQDNKTRTVFRFNDPMKKDRVDNNQQCGTINISFFLVRKNVYFEYLKIN